MNKASVRNKLLTARRSLSAEERKNATYTILSQVISHPCWLAAQQIGCYLSLTDEVFTHDLVAYALAIGKQVSAPVIHPLEHELYFCPVNKISSLKPGPLGILEPQLQNPLSPDQLDLVIVPGVGFDIKGNRLGFGKGFYDRFLSRSPAFRLALAFDVQVVKELPVTAQDIPMHLIITEKRLILPDNSAN